MVRIDWADRNYFEQGNGMRVCRIPEYGKSGQEACRLSHPYDSEAVGFTLKQNAVASAGISGTRNGGDDGLDWAMTCIILYS